MAAYTNQNGASSAGANTSRQRGTNAEMSKNATTSAAQNNETRVNCASANKPSACNPSSDHVSRRASFGGRVNWSAASWYAQRCENTGNFKSTRFDNRECWRQ